MKTKEDYNGVIVEVTWESNMFLIEAIDDHTYTYEATGTDSYGHKWIGTLVVIDGHYEEIIDVESR